MTDDPVQLTPAADDDTRRVLDALDFEIAQIRIEQQNLGWTTWAAFAGIGGALWLLIDQIKSVSSLSNVSHVYFVCALTCVAISSAYYVLHPRGTPDHERRVRPLQLKLEPNADPPVLLLSVAELVALCLIAVYAWPEASLPARVLAAILSGGLAVTATVGFACMLFNFQVRSGTSTRTAVITSVVFLAVLAWTLGEYSRLLLTDRSITASDYRTGGLIEGLVILLVMLGRSLRRPLLLEPLIALRRDVALKRIDLIQAQRQIEILVLGMKVEEALQRDVERLFQILRAQSEELRTILDESERRSSSQDASTSNTDFATWWAPHDARLHKLQRRLVKDFVRYGARSGAWLDRDSTASAAGREIQNRILDEVQKVQRETRVVVSRINKNATPQPLLELIVSGTMILDTGNKFVETAKALTAQCNAGMRPKQFCADFKTFALDFKAKWPLAADEWRAAVRANDASKQRTAEAMIRLLRTELDTYIAPYS